MKTLLIFITSLAISPLLLASVEIKGIEFSKAESIASVLRGVNEIRGTQNVELALDKKRKLHIIDSSQFPACPILYIMKAEGIRREKTGPILSRDELIKELEDLKAMSKSFGNVYVSIHFDSEVTGVEGHSILKDFSDHDVGIIFTREETRKERTLRLKESQNLKPRSPEIQMQNKTLHPIDDGAGESSKHDK